MTHHNFVRLKITRGLTAICTCVLLSVSLYSFFLGAKSFIFPESEKTVSAGVKDGCPVIIDPGHGGEDGGAQSEDGILEKHINLAISKNLSDIFNFFGYETIMTRDDDKLIYDKGSSSIREKKVSDIHNRMSICEKNPGGILLSIHQNHYEGTSSCGTQVFYSGNNPLSEKIADSIQTTIVADIQKDNRRLIKQSGKEIYLLCHAKIPAVMVECGFLSNPEEAKKLNEENYQRLMAFEIFKGAVSFVK